MSDFIKELEEDIKEEQLINLWKKYGNYIIGAAISIVVIAAAVPAYKSYQRSQSLNASETYAQALRYVEKGRDDKAIELFDQLIADHRGYGKLATLQKAALLTDIAMSQGKITLMDEAQKLYQTTAAQNSKDPSLKGLAVILEAYRSVSMGEEGNWLAQVEPLTAPNQPWRALAEEVLALEELRKGQDAEAARRLVNVLQDKQASPATQRRAMLILASIQAPLAVPAQPES